MAKARINGIDIHYEVHGEGEPLLLIQGLGHSSKFWFFQIPEFSKRFQTIVYDNRGIGDSDKPDEPYSIAGEAVDAMGLLDHLKIDRAHVLGVSRGGYIAQELAISHPEVKYLTTPAFFARETKMVERLVEIRMANPQPAYAFQRQFAGAAAFDAKERVKGIAVPTLVIAGEEDRVVPNWLSEKLARQISNARFEIIEGVAHLSFIEQPDVVNRMVVEFLEE
jgi:pimeloyl-ACP methyl ester carboxylesterase